MRIGVFSDVHGHLAELNATLALFAFHQVDEIICAGDLVDKGNASNAVVATIREHKIPTVMGNHDQKAMFAWRPELEKLTDPTIDTIRQLPDHLSFNWNGVSAYLCHSTPWQDASVYVSPSQPKVLFQFIVEAVSESIIILGHSHHPMHVELDGRLILNPGSIYANRNRSERTCGILSLPQQRFDLYDIDTGQPLEVERITLD
ncbi:MAG: metallophosphoesterase family protein [Chloroflexota bacterium]